MEVTVEKTAYVVGVDPEPSSILCKDVCKSCMAAHRRSWAVWGTNSETAVPWNSEDELRWSKGKICCAGFHWETFKFIAEKDCRYRLEHVVSEGKP